MFGSSNGNDQKNKNKKVSKDGVNSQSTNSLVRGTSVEGTITTESDIRIDGKLTGHLISKGKVIIGPSGEINGDIECQNAMIEGHFSGRLHVHELLQVKDSAHIEGEVQTNKLVVQSGSIFNVTCSMGGKKMKARRSESLELEKLSKVVKTA
ncbi:MAG: polymer-forming cytoskeletal protein [Bacteroidetes bacterium]|nr:MAG: polymer-forming cytoskeletal protein [Bacteroidota bacterium]